MGIHSFFLPGVSSDWIWNKYFFTLCLTTDIEAARSEFGDEPGTIRLFEWGLHGLSYWLMRPFHILVTEYTKFCLEISKLIFGRIMRKFDTLGLRQNSSYREIGSLSFMILNVSTNECRIYKFLTLRIFSELKMGFVCSSWKFFFAVCSE